MFPPTLSNCHVVSPVYSAGDGEGGEGRRLAEHGHGDRVAVDLYGGSVGPRTHGYGVATVVDECVIVHEPVEAELQYGGEPHRAELWDRSSPS